MPTVNFPLARRYNAFMHVAESKGAHQFFSLPAVRSDVE